MKWLWNVVAGAIAGTLATYVMGLVNDAIHDRQSESVKQRERELEAHTAPQTLGQRMLRGVGVEPSEEEITAAGKLLHWGFGISMGMLYGAINRDVRKLKPSLGIRFSMALFGIHLFVIPAMGLAPSSMRFPSQTAVRGFLYHFAYGGVLAVSYRFLTRLGDGRRRRG